MTRSWATDGHWHPRRAPTTVQPQPSGSACALLRGGGAGLRDRDVPGVMDDRERHSAGSAQHALAATVHPPGDQPDPARAAVSRLPGHHLGHQLDHYLVAEHGALSRTRHLRRVHTVLLALEGPRRL